MRNNPERVFNYFERKVEFSSVTLSEVDRDDAAFPITEHDPLAQKIIINEKAYYTMPGSALLGKKMGKAKKILLISEDHYLKCLKSNEFSPDAMLKLPKRCDVLQVQQEAMALGISTALGLNTTDSIMVVFDNKPALFVPFDEIKSLDEIARGDIEIPNEDGRIDYEDSTLNPLGEGLSPNEFVDDFGKAFVLMYLTGDPDAAGAYNQNKAIQGRSLYVFDQAIVEAPIFQDFFSVSSSLRLTPYFLAAYSRHTRGRNLFLLEDASIASKFDSLSDENYQKVRTYICEVISGLQEAITKIQDKNEITLHNNLIISARNVQSLIQERIDKYKRALLPFSGVDDAIVKSALVCENILNKSRLYSRGGRPYRNLMTDSEHSLKITQIKKGREHNKVELHFNQSLSDTSKNMLMSIAPSIIIEADRKTIIIDKRTLEKLEQLIYPEKDVLFVKGVNNLSTKSIAFLAESYQADATEVLKIITKHRREYDNTSLTVARKIDLLDKTRDKLKVLQHEDVGFKQHIVKKFELELQKQLSKIIYKELNITEIDKNEFLHAQNKAFSCAAKLDLIVEFNNLSLFIARNRNNEAVIREVSLLFAKYNDLDLSGMTLENATYLRTEMLGDIDYIVKPKVANTDSDTHTAIYRDAVQTLKQADTPQFAEQPNSRP